MIVVHLKLYSSIFISVHSLIVLRPFFLHWSFHVSICLSIYPFFRYYWYKNTLEATEDISVAGEFNWRVMLTLLAAWFVVYLCMFKGIQSSGKVSQML